PCLFCFIFCLPYQFLRIGKNPLHESMNRKLNFAPVSRPIEPPYTGLFAKPGHLTLRIPPRVPLDYTNGFLPGVTTFQIGGSLAVADRPQSARIARQPCRHQAL